MRSFRAKPIGWQHESYRHYLAAKGIKTRYAAKMNDDEVRRKTFHLRNRKLTDVERQIVIAGLKKKFVELEKKWADAQKIDDQLSMDALYEDMQFIEGEIEDLDDEFYAVKDDVLEKSYLKKQQRHKLGEEIDTNIEKLDERISALRGEMDALLPTKDERDRRDVNSLTEADKEKAKKYFELEAKLKDVKMRKERLEKLRPGYFAKKSYVDPNTGIDSLKELERAYALRDPDGSTFVTNNPGILRDRVDLEKSHPGIKILSVSEVNKRKMPKDAVFIMPPDQKKLLMDRMRARGLSEEEAERRIREAMDKIYRDMK